MTSHERQRRVWALLHETADEIPAQTGLLAGIRARAEQASYASAHATQDDRRASHLTSGGARSLPRWSLPAAVLVVVAALVLSAFAFARPLISSWLGDSGLKAVALQDGTLINQQVTVNGITLEVEQGYADAARTALTMRTTAAAATSGTSDSDMPVPGEMELIDAQQHVYKFFTGTQVEHDGLYEFLPLPPAELDAPQPLTLVVETMERADNVTQIAGPWQLGFTLRPQPGRSVALTQAPVTHSGVTIQPERLDLAPSGVRLLVRLSGLKPDTSLFSLIHFATHGDDIVGCPPGGHYCVSSGGEGDGAPMHLRGPDGQTLVPGKVVVVRQSIAVAPATGEAVGPSGSAEIAFLFFTPLHAAHGTAQVVVEQARLSSIHDDANAPEQIVSGPWVFSLSLP